MTRRERVHKLSKVNCSRVFLRLDAAAVVLAACAAAAKEEAAGARAAVWLPVLLVVPPDEPAPVVRVPGTWKSNWDVEILSSTGISPAA
jgi:hypothetical protein